MRVQNFSKINQFGQRENFSISKTTINAILQSVYIKRYPFQSGKFLLDNFLAELTNARKGNSSPQKRVGGNNYQVNQ